MSIEHIIEALENERERVTQAINLLNGNGRRGRKPHRHLSAEARRRIGAAMRRRWAERKKNGKAA